MVKKTKKKVKVAKKKEVEGNEVADKKVEGKKVEKKETASVEELLKLLAKAKDAEEKKKLRTRLRRLGHTGGLRVQKAS